MQKTKENIGWRQKGRTESESNGGVQTYMGIVDDNLVEVQLENRRMPNGTYGGVRGRKTKVGGKLLRFPPTRLFAQHERILTGASPQAALTVGRL